MKWGGGLCVFRLFLSPPSRGAWIEITIAQKIRSCNGKVAPLAGGVD